jgi:excisionase family DNA binding protein
MLTAKEVADLLQLSLRTVRRMLKDGRLRAVRFESALRIRPEAVAALLGDTG